MYITYACTQHSTAEQKISKWKGKEWNDIGGGTKMIDPMYNVWYAKLKEDTGDRYDFYKTYLFFALFVLSLRCMQKKNKKCA